MKETIENIQACLKDTQTLRDFIRSLWAKVRSQEITADDAYDILDTASDVEIKGACRSDIMDILDKATLAAGGNSPIIKVEEYDKQFMAPDNVKLSLEGRAPPKNIIRLDDIKRI